MPLFEGIGYGGEKTAVILDIGAAYTKYVVVENRLYDCHIGTVHYGVGSWSLYTKQATPGSPPLLCRGHPTQSATSTMEPQGFQWALTQWRRSPVKVTRSPWDYFLKTQNGWQPTCVDMQNNVENVFVECTIYFLTIMQLTEAGLSIWQVQ